MSLLALLLAGCLNNQQGNLTVSVYHPLSGHRPIVVDPSQKNFEGLKLVVHCVPGEFIKRGGLVSLVPPITEPNVQLCRKMSTLFTNQGAEVQTVRSEFMREDPFTVDDGGDPDADPWERRGADLILEMRPKLISKNNNTLSWSLAIATFTIVPAVDDRSFAQELTVRDGDGFLLAQDTYRGRMIRRTGIATWAGNWVIDRVAREPEDRLTGDAAQRDISEHLYGQVTQLVYNAKVRQELLREMKP